MSLRARLLALEAAASARQAQASYPNGLGPINEMLNVVGAIEKMSSLGDLQTLVKQMAERLRNGQPSDADLALQARLKFGRDALLAALQSYLDLAEFYPASEDLPADRGNCR